MDDKTPDPGFAEVLLALRVRSGLSYEELARRTFTSASTLHRYCTGKTMPVDGEVVARIAQACGADPAEAGDLLQRWKATVAAGRAAGTAQGAHPATPAAPAVPAGTAVVVPARAADPGRGRAYRRAALAGVPAVSVLAAGLVLLTRGGDRPHAVRTAATAADACVSREGVKRNDGPGATYNQVWTREEVCPTVAGSPLYESPAAAEGPGAVRIGTMFSTKSWFVCWTLGHRHAGGNRVWYYTQGDVSVRPYQARLAWGFMPARYVQTKVDPDPGLAPCPDAGVVGTTPVP
jgi:transcriptional regulator with XRE-family HTH domain